MVVSVLVCIGCFCVASYVGPDYYIFLITVLEKHLVLCSAL
jgi:hypothetical protein